MTDLAARLRELAATTDPLAMLEAADMIDQQQTEIERMRRALKALGVPESAFTREEG